MILIYYNSNPIMGSLLSAACTAVEFNYGQARFPLLRGPFLPVLVAPGCWRGGGGRVGRCRVEKERLSGVREWQAVAALPAAGGCTGQDVWRCLVSDN